MNTTFRTTVFKRARIIEQTTGKSFPAALTKAWQLHRLTLRMLTGVVYFSFECKNGSLRQAKGTLMTEILPHRIPGKDRVKSPEKGRYKTYRYFDVEKNSFRSFRVSNLVNIY